MPTRITLSTNYVALRYCCIKDCSLYSLPVPYGIVPYRTVCTILYYFTTVRYRTVRHPVLDRSRSPVMYRTVPYRTVWLLPIFPKLCIVRWRKTIIPPSSTNRTPVKSLQFTTPRYNAEYRYGTVPYRYRLPTEYMQGKGLINLENPLVTYINLRKRIIRYPTWLYKWFYDNH